jgi:hypothetical protein
MFYQMETASSYDASKCEATKESWKPWRDLPPLLKRLSKNCCRKSNVGVLMTRRHKDSSSLFDLTFLFYVLS